MQTTYTAKFNRQARQWDVVDQNGQIVGMFGGSKRGQADAERSARNLTELEGGR